MNISEIITNPARDEYIANKSIYFDKSPILSTVGGLDLKRTTVDEDIWYGLFDKNELVGILQLGSYDSSKWQVRLVQIDERYKGHGYGTFLYDYAVMNDGLTILSDTSNSEGGPGGSRGLWERIYRQGRYTVCGYDLDTNTILSSVKPTDIYNQKENIVWMATPKKNQERISEMLKRINEANGYRTTVWYGPEVKDWF
jgi:hypothetical protein